MTTTVQTGTGRGVMAAGAGARSLIESTVTDTCMASILLGVLELTSKNLMTYPGVNGTPPPKSIQSKSQQSPPLSVRPGLLSWSNMVITTLGADPPPYSRWQHVLSVYPPAMNKR